MGKGATTPMTHYLTYLDLLVPLVGQEGQEGQEGQGPCTRKPEPLAPTEAIAKGRESASTSTPSRPLDALGLAARRSPTTPDYSSGRSPRENGPSAAWAYGILTPWAAGQGRAPWGGFRRKQTRISGLQRERARTGHGGGLAAAQDVQLSGRDPAAHALPTPSPIGAVSVSGEKVQGPGPDFWEKTEVKT